MTSRATTPEQKCPDCGGVLAISSGPNRTRRYRGEDGYVLPDDLLFPACIACGAEWLTDSQLETLSAAFEAQRIAREDGGCGGSGSLHKLAKA